MIKSLYGASIALTLGLGGAAFAQTAATPMPPAQNPAPQAAGPASSKLSAADQDFVNNAAIGGMFEVKTGQLAEKSANPQVKEFGARMVRDHGAADAKLKQIVAQEGGTLPPALDQEHQQKLDQLSALKGPDFARQYMQTMVQDHDTDAQDFGKAAQSLSDPKLKQFAEQTLKTIETHDKMAHQIAEKSASK